MAEVRQFKLTEPLETKELVDWRQTLEVKLALLRPPSNTATATAATNVSTTTARKGCFLKVHWINQVVEIKGSAEAAKFKQESAAHSSLPEYTAE